MSTDSRRVIWSWALYDFAKFAVHDAGRDVRVRDLLHASDRRRSDSWHGVVVAGGHGDGRARRSAFPFLGALADRGGYRKVFVAGFTWLCIAATVALYFVRFGPFLLGVLTDVSGSQRIGVSAVLALFVAGLPLLM